MTNTFEYSIIRIEPDPRRGERVNVGLVVFCKDDLDIRVFETGKAAAIASNDWDAHLQAFSSFLKDQWADTKYPEDAINLVTNFERQIALTKLGWFEANNSQNYEAAISRIIDTLIKKPKRPQKTRKAGIASKIASEFKSANILAAKGEDITSGNVIRNYIVDEETGLKADFALKNGSLHLAETVDLTTAHPHIGTAAEAAITLDKARKLFRGTKAYGVYLIAESRRAEVREHLAILGDYSTDIFNWADRDERRKFKQLFFDAYNANHPMRSDL